MTESLEASGIAIGFDQDRGEIPEACDLLIASAAIRADHPEMLAATERGVRTLTYAEALGRCMLGRSGVCIAGTHGKSSITAMLGAALTDAGLDPTVIVGALCSQLATGCLTSEGVPAKADVASDGKSARTGFRLGADSIPTGELAGAPGAAAGRVVRVQPLIPPPPTDGRGHHVGRGRPPRYLWLARRGGGELRGVCAVAALGRAGGIC